MTKTQAKASPSMFRKILKLFKWCAYTAIILIALVGLGGLGLYYYISKDLPNLTKIEDYQPRVMAEVYDDAGQKIGEFWTEARILTPINAIPKKLIEAFVSSEDDRFFEHRGVDPYGIVRAFIHNLQAGQVQQGASTITQQVTKALLLSPERTYERKVKEAILATRIEQNLTKEQILYIYLNQIYFGNRAYGVAAAARNYFHKNLDELNLAEMAMIAGLAKGPSRFNPVVNPPRAKERMEYVLDRMVIQGYITPSQAQEAKNTPLYVYKAKTDKEFNYQYAPFFVEEVRRILQKKYGTEKLYTSGWKIYTTANLKMNEEGQKAVLDGVERFSKKFGYRGPVAHLENQAAIDEFLRDTHYQIMDGAGQINYYLDPGMKNAMKKPTPLKAGQIYEGVVVATGTKELKVRVGNTEAPLAYKDWSWAKRTARGNNPWRPQVGDVIEVKLKTATQKPNEKSEEKAVTLSKAFILFQSPEVQSALFSYEPFTGAVKAVIGGQNYRKSEFNRATQALLQPGSAIKPLIYAAALDKGYTPGTVVTDSPITYEEAPGKFWSPRNYGGKYYGPTLFRHCLVNSRNVPTVRILMDIGTHYVTGFMRKLGVTTPIYKYYSMALGSNEVKLAELATAYGTFVTGGVPPKIHYIAKIEDPSGKLVEAFTPPQTQYLISYQDQKVGVEEKPPAPKSQQNNESQDNEAAEDTEEDHSQPMGSQSATWEEMGYNDTLFSTGQERIKTDDLLLTSYEKKILYGDYIPPGYAITPKTAVTMVSILQDVVRAGTGARARALEKPAGGKTGTTNDATDAWFIGFTPTLLTGIWVGFDEERRTLGRGATGGGVAAPIWLAYMKEATKNYPTKTFTIPQWVDLSVYEAPIQVATGVGDAELGDEGVGTGVTANTGPSGPAPSSTEFFVQDLE